MWNILNSLQRRLIIAIPASMALGLTGGYLFDMSFLQAFILPMTFLMVYPMMVNLQIKKVFSPGDTTLQLATQFINFAIIPFIAIAIGMFFFPHQPLLALGLLLASLLPTSGMTISWTGLSKGNINAAVKMTVIGLVAGSLLTPLYANWFMGAVIEIPMMKIVKQIVVVVFLPMLAGFLTQQFLIKKFGEERFKRDFKIKFPLFSTLGVLLIVFTAMALKAESIFARPEKLAGMFIPLALLYIINYTISTIAGKIFFKRADAIALVYGTVMRNLSIALAISMTVFGEKGSEIAIIIAMAFIIQAQSSAWYVKFTDRIFGPYKTDGSEKEKNKNKAQPVETALQVE